MTHQKIKELEAKAAKLWLEGRKRMDEADQLWLEATVLMSQTRTLEEQQKQEEQE